MKLTFSREHVVTAVRFLVKFDAPTFTITNPDGFGATWTIDFPSHRSLELTESLRELSLKAAGGS